MKGFALSLAAAAKRVGRAAVGLGGAVASLRGAVASLGRAAVSLGGAAVTVAGAVVSLGGVIAPSLAIMAAPAITAAAAVGGTAPSAAQSAAPAAEDTGIAPFSAHYLADWKSINVGTSDLKLERDAEPGHYVYTWTITARGIFRLYRAQVTQKSWLSINANHVRPDKYHAEDGASSVNLDFDWNSRRARGMSENKAGGPARSKTEPRT